MIAECNTFTFKKEDDHEIIKSFFGTAPSHVKDSCRAFLQIMKNNANTNLNLLDVGCRDSVLRSFFASQKYNWTGIDIQTLDNQVVKGDMHNLPFGDQAFNLIFCCHVFEHSDRPLLLLKELGRVTTAGGFVFLSTPAYSEYQIFRCDKTHILVPTMVQMKRLAELASMPIKHLMYHKEEGTEDKYASLITVLEVVK